MFLLFLLVNGVFVDFMYPLSCYVEIFSYYRSNEYLWLVIQSIIVKNMGNQVGLDNEFEPEQNSTRHAVSSSRDIPHRSHHGHRSNRHLKSNVTLIPLSGSPKTGINLSQTVGPLEGNSSDQGEQSQIIYHLSPGQSRTANELTEEEKVRVAQREGLIDHLPRNTWDENHVANKKVRECCICMIDFEQDEPIRYLPCMHYYHLDCIDDWLMRSFTCPTCMEPVDAALLLSYDSQNLDSG